MMVVVFIALSSGTEWGVTIKMHSAFDFVIHSPMARCCWWSLATRGHTTVRCVLVAFAFFFSNIILRVIHRALFEFKSLPCDSEYIAVAAPTDLERLS